MSLREFVHDLANSCNLANPRTPLSSRLEAAAFMKAMDGHPVLIHTRESTYPVIANACSTRLLVSQYLGIPPREILRVLLNAIDNPTKPSHAEDAPALETVDDVTDLSKLPLLFHCVGDGGHYVTSGIVIASHPSIGQNVSFHRLMQIDKDSFAIRIVPRHLHEILERNGGEADVAVCIGNPPNILLGAACSVDLGVDELEIANTLKPFNATWFEEANCIVPAESEFIMVGRITRELHDEGPFVDLTETYDIVRKQPILKIKRVYHRKDPYYQAILPGGLEHKLLMGMPREATIMREVLKVCECTDVSLTYGGCSWLHGVVKIRKRGEEDGHRAIEASFKGHPSMKHVVILDDDIDIHNPAEVEWAIATRFQANGRLTVKEREIGSSLDPSADPDTRLTTKLGLDATKPLVAHGKNFERATYATIDVNNYM